MNIDKKNKKLKGFFSNFASWLIISTFLFIINGITYKGHWWAIWPLLGWGLGVAFHAMSVFKYLIFNPQQNNEPEYTDTSNAAPYRELPDASDYQPLNENRRKVKTPRDFDESEFV